MGRADARDPSEGTSQRSSKSTMAGLGAMRFVTRLFVQCLLWPAGQKIGAGVADEEDLTSTAVEASCRMVSLWMLTTNLLFRGGGGRSPSFDDAAAANTTAEGGLPTGRSASSYLFVCLSVWQHRFLKKRANRQEPCGADGGVMCPCEAPAFLKEPSLCGFPMKWLSLVSLTPLGHDGW